MSSSAPDGSFGRVFGLHGKGSEGSKEVDGGEASCSESAAISWGCMFRTFATDRGLAGSVLNVAMAVTIALLRNARDSSSSLESAAISRGSIFIKAAPDRVSKVSIFWSIDEAEEVDDDEEAMATSGDELKFELELEGLSLSLRV